MKTTLKFFGYNKRLYIFISIFLEINLDRILIPIIRIFRYRYYLNSQLIGGYVFRYYLRISVVLELNSDSIFLKRVQTRVPDYLFRIQFVYTQ